MKQETSVPMNPQEMLGLFSKHRRFIISATLLSTVAFTLTAMFLPRRYKSAFVLTIYSNYFQNPMTRDFTSEIYDSTEMKAQREALIRQSLTNEYVDAIGKKYGIYHTPGQGGWRRFINAFRLSTASDGETQAMRKRSQERHDLTSRIQVMNLNSNTFQVSFVYSNPDIVYHVTRDLNAQVIQGLMDVRRNNLNAIYGSIEKRLGALEIKLPTLDATANSMNGVNSAQPTVIEPPTNAPSLQDELIDIRRQLKIMSARYTEEHPLVRELRDRERVLVALVGATGGATGSESYEKPFSVRMPQGAAEEIYKELSKKLNYLNVSLASDQLRPSDYYAVLERPQYPATPLWPKKGLFILWGVAVGFLGSLAIVALREYFDRVALRTPTVADSLGVPVLGEIPMIAWGAAYPRLVHTNGATNHVRTPL